MRWSDFAVQDLKKYAALKASLSNITARLDMLELKLSSISGQQTNKTVVKGSNSCHEDFMLDNIVERDRLMLLRTTNLQLVQLIEKGLAPLSQAERKVLDCFYIHRPANHVEKLIEELHLEQAQIYRIKDTALYKFTLNMYGAEEC